ncbi:MAG: RNase E specificity factor CsrD [Yokenella regensburgei]|jgi:RNase E specificity factor CsrD|uniref:RNase E specificity factor CsrD n=1 Tax=Yokenella regensburgei TaxID=158877 RepID=A0AB38G0W5_9ENTR|nr:RNase E specificity factor CsrD [Yokenella regensburgei]EHM49628.1 diguanylate cyclase domain protein [Yokenella regensburgei ATCC 43003]KAF1369732.1 RNase E specificity factor CsrD [Yokenella regensburgei]KFD22928.1 putative lipoprotein [Yokenella regensburgei ATCC 49455]MDR2218528.1 RNase E specificity factor CsrD [Yokenella regensburgei]MDR3104992.1 RNase E specificity factor CsrD [Yokenella regensburgei]
MRLTTKFSAFVTLLVGLAIFVTLVGCSLSFYNGIQLKLQKRVQAVATVLDNRLITTSFDKLDTQLDELLVPVDIVRVDFIVDHKSIFNHSRGSSYRPAGSSYQFRNIDVESVKHPGMTIRMVYQDPMVNYFHSLSTTAPLTVAIAFMVMVIFFAVRWLRRQLSGQELLDLRSARILNGERGPQVRGSVHEWPARTSSALDKLLSEIQFASDQRSRMDTLIRSYAAQDTRTGLNNRLFFDNQLVTLLEDQERVGSHGIVMMIRLPDFDLLRDNWGQTAAEEYLFTIINLLSTFMLRYPGALLARYHRSDFAVLLPHRTLKEADSIASQLLKAVDALPPTRIRDREDMMHIGICAWRSGQTKDQVMEHAEAATRNAVLQGSNSWAVYDDTLPEKGRGNVRWRTMIEQMLSRGGPRFYQKPAVTRNGHVHHRELMCRLYDGNEEVIAAEYMPMVLQFGLSEEYDRLQITRLLPFLSFWPEENLALQVTVESLIRPRFQRWLRDTLMQCEKSQRKRIIFELAEADVCQHISRLQPVMRLINALGVRAAVIQAGLTLVSTDWIKVLNVEIIKLHPGLVRNIEKRSENQLLVQSLVEACKGTETQVYATGLRSRSEWLVLTECGVTGGQGDFFAGSQPLDTSVKKYSQRYSV